jgi:hypothetical protein
VCSKFSLCAVVQPSFAAYIMQCTITFKCFGWCLGFTSVGRSLTFDTSDETFLEASTASVCDLDNATYLSVYYWTASVAQEKHRLVVISVLMCVTSLECSHLTGVVQGLLFFCLQTMYDKGSA